MLLALQGSFNAWQKYRDVMLFTPSYPQKTVPQNALIVFLPSILIVSFVLEEYVPLTSQLVFQ